MNNATQLLSTHISEIKDSGKFFVWPSWAIEQVNTLIKSGRKIEESIKLVSDKLKKDRPQEFLY